MVVAMNSITQSGAQMKSFAQANTATTAGAPAEQTFESILDERHQVQYLLYKLAKSGAHPVPISEVSIYNRVEDIPPEALRVLLVDLKQELRTKEILGDASYYGSRTIEQKLRMYLQAQDQIAEEISAGKMQNRTVTWAEWRRMISNEILSWGDVRP